MAVRAPGIATRNKKLLGAPGIATRNKKLRRGPALHGLEGGLDEYALLTCSY